MTMQTLARPQTQPAASPMLDRIFAVPAPANDTAAAPAALLVRRRDAR